MRSKYQNQQKNNMPGQSLPGDIELAADCLRDAKDDAACERTPHAAEAAEDDDLEGDQKARGPEEGSKLLQIDMKPAATAMVTKDMPIATA